MGLTFTPQALLFSMLCLDPPLSAGKEVDTIILFARKVDHESVNRPQQSVHADHDQRRAA